MKRADLFVLLFLFHIFIVHIKSFFFLPFFLKIGVIMYYEKGKLGMEFTSYGMGRLKSVVLAMLMKKTVLNFS